MRTFSRTSQFKKDVRRAEKRGDFAGSRDCHIEPDWILIYTLTENDMHVRFERTGTHSDLFR